MRAMIRQREMRGLFIDADTPRELAKMFADAVSA